MTVPDDIDAEIVNFHLIHRITENMILQNMIFQNIFVT